MPRKAAADLVLGGPRVRRTEPPQTTGSLTWHHTEFGRRSDCLGYHVVHHGGGWQLLDQATWDPIGAPVPTIDAALQAAERHAARAARSTGNVSDKPPVSQTP